MLRSSNELQMRSPRGPNAVITQETSKYGTKQLRAAGMLGMKKPRGCKFTKEGTSRNWLSRPRRFEGRRTETGDFVGRQGQVPSAETVRNGREVLLGGHISQKSEAQWHPVQPLPAEQLWPPHLWRKPVWQAVGKNQRMEKYLVHRIVYCQFEGQLADRSLKESRLSSCYTH